MITENDITVKTFPSKAFTQNVFILETIFIGLSSDKSFSGAFALGWQISVDSLETCQNEILMFFVDYIINFA